MSRWIEVDPNEINEVRSVRADGDSIRVHLSPYDVPEAVRGYQDDNRNCFVIEFRYIAGGDEPLQQETAGNIAMFIGQQSGRLRRIEVDCKKINLGPVSVQVSSSINQLSTQHRPSREWNYKAARKVFDKNQREIFKDLAEQH